MCCSQLSMLNDLLSEEEIISLENFFYSLTPNTIDRITASKISNYLSVDFETARKVLMKCKNAGFLKLTFGIKCPNCGGLVKKVSDLSEVEEVLDYCYICGEENLDISEDDIELMFELLIDSNSFLPGQQMGKVIRLNSTDVARENSLLSFINNGVLDLNKELFSPTDCEYKTILSLCDNAKKAKDKEEKGKTLERLAKYLFNLCKIFKANEIRTSVNQIDCYVRNKVFMPIGVFKILGSRIIIECKNESKIPSGSYISKLHSIITEINGKGEFIKFGIIFSKCKAPKTYREHATKYYLAQKVVVIHFYLEEIIQMANDRGCLLDLIEQKAEEIILDATTDLKVAGLYD